MKIGFMIWHDVIAGGHMVIYKHAHFLKSRGHDVSAIYVNTDDEYGGKYYPNFDINIKRYDEVVASNEEYDLIIAGFWPTVFSMMLVSSKHYLYFVQSDERRFFDSPYDASIPFVGKTYSFPAIGIITEAKWIKNFLEVDFDATVEYAPNGIDNALFNTEVKPLAERGGGRLRVLIEGPGKVNFKRVDFAFSIANQFDNIEVWYVSSDGYVADHWRYDRLFSAVPFEKMPEVYRSCDIFLKFSVVEGFFGPPLEMMACGGACLVGNVSGYDEYIVNEYNALVIDLDNKEQALNSLSRLLNDKSLRNKIAENGVLTAKSMDWNDRCKFFEEGITSLLERTVELKERDRLDILMHRSMLETLWLSQKNSSDINKLNEL
jgi:glycosyltransferase involved in cell wall biosynthesis